MFMSGNRVIPALLEAAGGWLRSFTPIIESVYVHGDSLTGRLSATPSCLGIELFLELDRSDFSLQFIDLLLQSP